MGWGTYAILDLGKLGLGHADTTGATQMPGGLTWHVLDHDAGKNGDFGVDGVEGCLGGEEEAIDDFAGDVFW